MQRDFIEFSESPVFIKTGRKIIENIKLLKENFLQNGQLIINIITEHSSIKELWGKKDIELDRSYCIKGTKGVEVISELMPLDIREKIIIKKYYSGFFETNLKKVLEKYNIKKLYFSGLTTGCCVSSTARDAYNYKFDLYFFKEALTSSNEESHLKELEFFQKSLGKVISVKDKINEI
jgi:nicotinamidase-related amidase